MTKNANESNNPFKKILDIEPEVEAPKNLKKQVESSYFTINTVMKLVELFVGILPEVVQKLFKR